MTSLFRTGESQQVHNSFISQASATLTPSRSKVSMPLHPRVLQRLCMRRFRWRLKLSARCVNELGRGQSTSSPGRALNGSGKRVDGGISFDNAVCRANSRENLCIRYGTKWYLTFDVMCKFMVACLSRAAMTGLSWAVLVLGE